MTIIVSPTQSDLNIALIGFLSSIMPPNMKIIKGQTNRVPEPKEADYIVFWPINRNRLSTNIDDAIDTSFTGFITAKQLLVNQVFFGEIKIGQTVFGALPGTIISSFGTGQGGAGSYSINVDQTNAGPRFYSGENDILQPTEVVMQLDIHGQNSSDNAQIISTMFRDVFAVDAMQAINPAITPLFADDPRQVPFTNAENQYEDRWIVDAHLEVNATIVIPQQFADVVEVDVISVEATYS